MRATYLRVVGILAVSAVVSAVTCPDTVPARVANGTWGGDHIGIVVSDSGATLDYDCASGTITQPLQLDASGAFDWRGVHYPGHGGATRVDEPPNAHPARYTGRATADRMTITLAVLDTSIPAQTFTLQRGGMPRVFKCA